MVYEKQTWVGSENPLEGEPGSTPLSDDRLNHLETQYDEAVEYVDEALEVKVDSDGVPSVGYRDTYAELLLIENPEIGSIWFTRSSA